MGILLFVLKYMYISLLVKMINGFSWLAKIMASSFKKDTIQKNYFQLEPNTNTNAIIFKVVVTW